MYVLRMDCNNGWERSYNRMVYKGTCPWVLCALSCHTYVCIHLSNKCLSTMLLTDTYTCTYIYMCEGSLVCMGITRGIISVRVMDMCMGMYLDQYACTHIHTYKQTHTSTHTQSKEHNTEWSEASIHDKNG